MTKLVIHTSENVKRNLHRSITIVKFDFTLYGFPPAPGALGSAGGGTTPSAWWSGSPFHLENTNQKCFNMSNISDLLMIIYNAFRLDNQN